MFNTANRPKKDENFLSFIFSVCLAFLFFAFLLYIYLTGFEKEKLYKDAQARFNDLFNNYTIDLATYRKDLIDYIHSIDRTYNIDRTASIPVKVSVNISTDRNSQYIGDKTSYNCTVNGIRIYADSINNSISLNLINELKIETEIREIDPTSDDVGKEQTNLIVNFPELNKGLTVHQVIRVKEHYGQMAGNEAVYNVVYKIIPEQALHFTSAQIMGFPQRPKAPEEPNKADFKPSIIFTIKTI